MGAYDVIIVGGGPAGSSCARALVKAGAKVAILDRARFPRVKLCAGWLSQPIWDVLEMHPRDYPRGLWPWDACHVHYRGRAYSIACRGWFIRRYELDHFLLERSGAALHLGTNVKGLARGDDGLWHVAVWPAARTARSRASSIRRARAARSACRSTSSSRTRR